MSKREKLIERFRNNPKNITFEEMDGLLASLDFTRTSKGSHFRYKKPGAFTISIVYRTPFILPVYVKKALRVIEEVLDLELDEG